MLLLCMCVFVHVHMRTSKCLCRDLKLRQCGYMCALKIYITSSVLLRAQYKTTVSFIHACVLDSLAQTNT